MLAWRSHIDGAVHIIKTRGRDEMCRTRLGSLLFTAVRHHLVCLRDHEPIPCNIHMGQQFNPPPGVSRPLFWRPTALWHRLVDVWWGYRVHLRSLPALRLGI